MDGSKGKNDPCWQRMFTACYAANVNAEKTKKRKTAEEVGGAESSQVGV